MQEFNIGRAWKLILNCRKAEASPSPSLAVNACMMGQLLLRSLMQMIGLVDLLSVHIQDGDHRAGSQRRQLWTDQQIWRPGVSVSVVHRCRSLLLSFSTCYLGILGLEGAINCILAQTSHQRITSEKRTKALLPKCPLFRGSTVYIWAMHMLNTHSFTLMWDLLRLIPITFIWFVIAHCTVTWWYSHVLVLQNVIRVVALVRCSLNWLVVTPTLTQPYVHPCLVGILYNF